jgi:homoserine dehydrogenase
MTGLGLLGCGTVGSAFANAVVGRGERDLELRAALVLHLDKERGFTDRRVLTTDPARVLADGSIDVVVEAMGGLEPAREYVLAALGRGKAVVTANKQLLARCGPELATHARANGVPLYFDACVGSALRAPSFVFSLPHGSVRRVGGILNATTNFLLTRMEEGVYLDEALAHAHRLGITEPQADEDTSGRDAAAKLAILATLAFGARIDPARLEYHGVESITAADVEAARRADMTIRHLAHARRTPSAVEYFVGPALVPLSHPCAATRSLQNLLLVDGDGFGRLALSGPGAGGAATASALLGDVLRAAHWPRLPIADALCVREAPTVYAPPRRLWLRFTRPEQALVVQGVVEHPGQLAEIDVDPPLTAFVTPPLARTTAADLVRRVAGVRGALALPILDDPAAPAREELEVGAAAAE